MRDPITINPPDPQAQDLDCDCLTCGAAFPSFGGIIQICPACHPTERAEHWAREAAASRDRWNTCQRAARGNRMPVSFWDLRGRCLSYTPANALRLPGYLAVPRSDCMAMADGYEAAQELGQAAAFRRDYLQASDQHARDSALVGHADRIRRTRAARRDMAVFRVGFCAMGAGNER